MGVDYPHGDTRRGPSNYLFSCYLRRSSRSRIGAGWSIDQRSVYIDVRVPRIFEGQRFSGSRLPDIHSLFRNTSKSIIQDAFPTCCSLRRGRPCSIRYSCPSKSSDAIFPYIFTC